MTDTVGINKIKDGSYENYKKYTLQYKLSDQIGLFNTLDCFLNLIAWLGGAKLYKRYQLMGGVHD